MSLVLMCLPGSTIPSNPFLTLVHADKWVHTCLFFGLCYLFSRPFRQSQFSSKKRGEWFLFIALAGIAYGTLMEFAQKYWVPNRSFELLDIGADSLGCMLGGWYSRKFFAGGV